MFRNMRRIDILSCFFAILSILCLFGSFFARSHGLSILFWVLVIPGMLMAIIFVLDTLDRCYYAFRDFVLKLSHQENHYHPY